MVVRLNISRPSMTRRRHRQLKLAPQCLYFILSSAQLLEPFRLNHDIQLISSGGGILSGSAGVPDLDRAPGAPATGMIPANLVVGPTTELEDPPGLYEKVCGVIPGCEM